MFDYFPLIALFLLVPLIVLVFIIVGVVAFFNNRNHNSNNMDPNQPTSPKESAKDVLLNLGAFIGLYTLISSLLSLLFTVINVAYPQITLGYNYSAGSQSISWPVSILIVFFPIFVLLMWFLERQYRTEPEMQNSITHKGLTYLTLFVSGLVIAGDLVTVVYYFVDGQELTTGFLLKVFVLLVIASGLFIYFISDLRGKLTSQSRKIWRIIAGVIILGSIVWGFAILGSPRTQQLLKYDEQKVTDLQTINNAVQNYYNSNHVLPSSFTNLSNSNNSYYITQNDQQTGKPYEYNKTSETTYSVCAEFNKTSDGQNSQIYSGPQTISLPPSYVNTQWTHPAGHYCFNETVNSMNNGPTISYPQPLPVMKY